MTTVPCSRSQGRVVLIKWSTPGVLQSHRVEHAAGSLRNPGRRIARALLQCDALTGNAPQCGQGIKFLIFMSKAEGSGSGDKGIGKLHPCYLHSHICHVTSCSFPLQRNFFIIEYRPVLTDVAKVLAAVLPEKGRGAAQTGPDAAGHALLQGDLGGDAPLFRQLAHSFQHGGRAAGKDDVCFRLFGAVDDQTVMAHTAVISGHKYPAAGSGEIRFQNRGVLIAETQGNRGIFAELASGGQQRRHADSPRR